MKGIECWNIKDVDFPKGNRVEQLKFLLKYSILAPSKYNRQPWKFQIVGEDIVNFFVDLSFPLPVADPFRYELIFSAGAVLKSFLIAAEFFGFATNTKLFPTDERPDLFASVKVSDKGVRSAQAMLCRQIPRRATARSDFAPGQIDESITEQLNRSVNDFEEIAVRMVEDKEGKKFICEIVSEAEQRISSQTEYHNELKTWLRTNFSKNNDGLPAYTFGISGLPSLLFPKLLYKKLLDPISGRRAKMLT